MRLCSLVAFDRSLEALSRRDLALSGKGRKARIRRKHKTLLILVLVAIIAAGGVYLYVFTRDRLIKNNGPQDSRSQTVSTDEELATESAKPNKSLNGATTNEDHNEDKEKISSVEENDTLKIELALVNFMDADIKEFDPDVMWDLISNNRKEKEARKTGLTREFFFQAWPEAWGGQSPYDYEFDNRLIAVSGDSARVIVTVRVLNSEETLRESVGLVRESDGWKIDTYPFVGWR